MRTRTLVSLGSYSHAAFNRILKSEGLRAVLTSPIPFRGSLRLFNQMFAASGRPAHGVTPLGYRPQLPSQPVAVSLPATLHLIGANFGGSADHRKPAPHPHYIMLWGSL